MNVRSSVVFHIKIKKKNSLPIYLPYFFQSRYRNLSYFYFRPYYDKLLIPLSNATGNNKTWHDFNVVVKINNGNIRTDNM